MAESDSEGIRLYAYGATGQVDGALVGWLASSSSRSERSLMPEEGTRLRGYAATAGKWRPKAEARCAEGSAPGSSFGNKN